MHKRDDKNAVSFFVGEQAQFFFCCKKAYYFFMKLSVRKIQVGFLVILMLLCGFVWYRVFCIPQNILTVAFLNVGQGDSIYIQAPNGNSALIDGGPPDGKALSELGSVMSFFDRDIDVVIATHPDQDHIGGLPEIFSRYHVGALFESGLTSENGVYSAMEKEAESDGTRKIIARGGEKIHLAQNVILEILYPNKNFPPRAETNSTSVVVKLTYGNESFLFTGDLPQEQENELVQKYGTALHVNVLKFGHHGSKTSTSPEFLSDVAPEYGIVSAGAGNKYGHPNKETLDLAEKDKVKVLRTDTEGRVVFETNGINLSLSQ